MQFQEQMSSTAYQRQVHDMKEAGLNPMLAANMGGASAPGGAMATAQEALGSAVSSAMQQKGAWAELKKVQAESRLTGEMARAAKYANVGNKIDAKIEKDLGPIYKPIQKFTPFLGWLKGILK